MIAIIMFCFIVSLLYCASEAWHERKFPSRMIRFAAIFGGIFLCSLSSFSQLQRFDYNAWTTNGTGSYIPVLAIPGAGIKFYSCSSALDSSCTTLLTTYTSITGGTACATNKQVVLLLTSTCIATADTQGNFGIWVGSSGTFGYAYTETIAGKVYGPYRFTVGGGSSGGVSQIVAGANVTISPIGGTGVVTINAATGSGSPCTTTAYGFQFNNAGSFGCGGLLTTDSNLKQLYGTSRSVNANGSNQAIASAWFCYPSSVPGLIQNNFGDGICNNTVVKAFMPGKNLGNPGGTPAGAGSGWFHYGVLEADATLREAGTKAGLKQIIRCYAVGDCNEPDLHYYSRLSGTEYSAEGAGGQDKGEEAGPPSGTITTGGSAATTVHVSPANDNHGIGEYLVDQTYDVGSFTISSIANSGSYGTFGISGGGGVTASVICSTVLTGIGVPALEEGTYQSKTITVNTTIDLAASIGVLLANVSPYPQAEKIVSVGTYNSGAHTQTVTLLLNKSIDDSSRYCVGGRAGGGLELNKTIVGGTTHYLYFVVGSPTTTSLDFTYPKGGNGPGGDTYANTSDAITVYHMATVVGLAESVLDAGIDILTLTDNDGRWSTTGGSNTFFSPNAINQTFSYTNTSLSVSDPMAIMNGYQLHLGAPTYVTPIQYLSANDTNSFYYSSFAASACPNGNALCGLFNAPSGLELKGVHGSGLYYDNAPESGGFPGTSGTVQAAAISMGPIAAGSSTTQWWLAEYRSNGDGLFYAPGTRTFSVNGAGYNAVICDAHNYTTVCPAGGVTSLAGSSPISVSASTGAVTVSCPTCGITGSPLSQFAATTSAQLAGVISDETGSGPLVFSVSPALTGTPTAPTATVGTNTTQLATTAFVIANAGSGSGISGLTANYIPKAGSATTLTANSALDDGVSLASTITSTEAVQVNMASGAITTPTNAVISAASASGSSTRIAAVSYGGQGFFSAATYGGTRASPTAVTATTQIGGVNAFAWDGTALGGPVASLRTFANENQAVGSHGSYADIATTPNGSTTLTQVLKFENDGGMTTPSVTGGDKGAGTINIGGLYQGGNAVGVVTSGLNQFASTTSAQLAGVISDETGSGLLVFGTSPTLVTPALGTPSALVGTNITGTGTGFTAGSSNALQSATTTVNTSSATAPTSGQVLTATSGTAATWQTPSGGTPAYPQTVTGCVSGGILYGSLSTQVTCAPLITANVLVKSGGAGAAPAASSITDNGTTISTAESISTTSSNGVSIGSAFGNTGIIKMASSGSANLVTIIAPTIAGGSGFNLTIPNITAADTFSVLGLAQTYTAKRTFNVPYALTQTTAPTVSSCGSGTMAAGSTDNAFTVTGVTAATACTVTFNVGITRAVCMANTNAAISPTINTVSTSAVTFTMTALTGTLYGHCD